MNKFYWKAICKENRQESISKINIVISKYGTVLNFQQSSDMSLGIVIEAEQCKAGGLFAELSKMLQFDKTDILPTNVSTGCIIFMNITFIGGTGELAIESPKVPG